MPARPTPVPRRRRQHAAAFAVAVLCAGLLGGCGFTDATERVYTPANGANENPAETEVAVLGAVIVSTTPGSGSFVATISNKSTEEPVSLNAVAGTDEDASVAAGQFVALPVAPTAFINLADTGGIPVTGDLAAGDFVRLNLGFDNGDRITINVPVVANAGDFAGLDGPAPATESAHEESDESGH